MATEAGGVVVTPTPSNSLLQARYAGSQGGDRARLQVVTRAWRRGLTHDAKPLRLGEPVAEDTMLLAYLIDPGRAEYELDDLMAEYAIELEPDPPAEEETAALVRHAEAARAWPTRSSRRSPNAARNTCTGRSSCR